MAIAAQQTGSAHAPQRPQPPDPPHRRLRIYTLDPAVATDYDTLAIGEMTLAVPWEPTLEPGPVGEYLEVVDADPASGRFYHPVDLNDPRLLAQDGLPPSETHPQFHQQMVYAVAMATIRHFEQALGRVALWATHKVRGADGTVTDSLFVRRLRIYPHALRDRNAYYSPAKCALLFGYFPAGLAERGSSAEPGTDTAQAMVYCALSHDIIAHETTHALLDGLHPHFSDAVNPDVLAFHEAFADIVALFQHFAYPGLLRNQIARSRGDLGNDSLLFQLARQFGRAAGRGGALRNALWQRGKDGTWHPRQPSAQALAGVDEPHARGEVLVAAVFGAYIKVYRARTRDLMRIASDGTGLVRAGELPPDLSSRLADEAAATAQRVLQSCIRALDYCPPVGLRFGDYLRALLTADTDIDPDDSWGWRVAVAESFRQWGLFPADAARTGLAADSLLWPTGEEALGTQHRLGEVQRVGLDFGASPVSDGAQDAAALGPDLEPWTLDTRRKDAWRGMNHNGCQIHTWLKGPGQPLLQALGFATVAESTPPTVSRDKAGQPAFQVHSVRTALRRSRRGTLVTDLVVELLQSRAGYDDELLQRQADGDPTAGAPPVPLPRRDFAFRAGCTLVLDQSGLTIRRVIPTASRITDDQALARVRAFRSGKGQTPANAFTPARPPAGNEAFALLHQHGDSDGDGD